MTDKNHICSWYWYYVSQNCSEIDFYY